jgi:hypothetical protein
MSISSQWPGYIAGAGAEIVERVTAVADPRDGDPQSALKCSAVCRARWALGSSRTPTWSRRPCRLYEHRKHDGSLPLVGLNTFTDPGADRVPCYRQGEEREGGAGLQPRPGWRTCTGIRCCRSLWSCAGLVNAVDWAVRHLVHGSVSCCCREYALCPAAPPRRACSPRTWHPRGRWTGLGLWRYRRLVLSPSRLSRRRTKA